MLIDGDDDRENTLWICAYEQNSQRARKELVCTGRTSRAFWRILSADLVNESITGSGVWSGLNLRISSSVICGQSADQFGSARLALIFPKTELGRLDKGFQRGLYPRAEPRRWMTIIPHSLIQMGIIWSNWQVTTEYGSGSERDGGGEARTGWPSVC